MSAFREQADITVSGHTSPFAVAVGVKQTWSVAAQMSDREPKADMACAVQNWPKAARARRAPKTARRSTPLAPPIDDNLQERLNEANTFCEQVHTVAVFGDGKVLLARALGAA
jgi:hypothetical protein